METKQEPKLIAEFAVNREMYRVVRRLDRFKDYDGAMVERLNFILERKTKNTLNEEHWEIHDRNICKNLYVGKLIDTLMTQLDEIQNPKGTENNN